jgi:hypothetical protein
VTVLLRLLLAALQIAHGAIHAGFISPRPSPAPGAPPWPFDLDRSWALGTMEPPARRLLGLALVAVTIGGFALGAIGALGIGPSVLFTAGVTVGSVGSLVLLLLWFHPWLIVGVAIDVVLLVVALVCEWTPPSLG